MSKKYILSLLILISFQFGWSQVDEEIDPEEEYYEEEEEFNFDKSILFGLNFQLGIPQGKFGQNLNYTGWGFGGNIMWQFKDSPLYGGIDFGFQNYDFEGSIDINGFGETIETQTKNSVALAHFQLRFYPEVNFFIRPYFEGMIGAKSLFTKTKWTDITNGSEDVISSQFDKSDFAFSVGGAVGFEIALVKEYLFLEGRCAYLKGTTADYFSRKTDGQNYFDTLDAFEEKNSATDILIPQIGIKFLVGFGGNVEEEYEDEEYYDDY